MRRKIVISVVIFIAIFSTGYAFTDTSLMQLLDEPESLEENAEAEVDLPIGERRAWRAPDYSNQPTALGYVPTTFDIPKGMEQRVDFWKNIYTRYSTDQGILHDSLHLGVIYEELDFNEIMKDPNLSERQKRRARRELLKDKKAKYREILRKLENVKDPAELAGDELRVWKLFEPYDEINKFRNAIGRNRMRFQLGQRDRFIKGIYFSGRYLHRMENIFREEGLPVELTRLPFVESSFNVKARSRVGASGVWQFMRYTGRRFMRISPAADQRNDPIKATRAAARLLRANYNILEKWPLAVTAYNHGAAGVRRMVKKFQTENIADLVDERHRRFGFASANFYASFLAALIAEREAETYFGKVYWDAPFDAIEIKAVKPISQQQLVKWFGGNKALVKELNPHLTYNFWRGYARLNKKDSFWVPIEKSEHVIVEIEKMPDKPQYAKDGTDIYMIAPGQTLSEIAQELGVSVRVLVEYNDIDNPRGIRPGQKLRIPIAN